jgi:hypothetical protein
MIATTLHPVAIKFDGTNALANPANLNDMANGDTLQFNSTDGAFRIVFKPWPFAEPANPQREVTTNTPLTFRNNEPFSLQFDFFCFVTPPGLAEVGYPGTSGGHGSVKPPGK